MNVVIIEDETSVAQNLSDLLFEINPEIKVLVVLETVQSSIRWFQKNNAPDIAFFDIKIADGSSFEILEKTKLNFPIIFTTAFDEYALKAFKYNSIDYLLKPIKKSDLEKAISKYQNLYTGDRIILDNNSKLIKTIREIKRSNTTNIYKSSFLVSYRNQLIPLDVHHIAYFYLENQLVYCRTIENKKYKISLTLEKLENQLNPRLFFRANRQCIVAKKAVRHANVVDKRKLKVVVVPEHFSEIIISKLKVTLFKKWIKE
ncbi:LytR/AlgR family response regulator transcription factor [Aquimarina litoralis]|uniref:LytR/AlgR family response regulator transcription factor n=1 Tax=Aquimarina litoralis TaxID=584605 RepID=UPI001C57920A|nr:response regulator transcription factor [Aquimarina litoralis]MBW1298981.1 response regulator [Aquimarina litoralis]